MYLFVRDVDCFGQYLTGMICTHLMHTANLQANTHHTHQFMIRKIRCLLKEREKPTKSLKFNRSTSLEIDWEIGGVFSVNSKGSKFHSFANVCLLAFESLMNVRNLFDSSFEVYMRWADDCGKT